MDWRDWLEDGFRRFRASPVEEQWLTGGTTVAAFAFALMYWSRFGNRAIILKCLGLAVGLHFLFWAYVDHYEVAKYLHSAPPPPPRTVRAPIQMSNREMTTVQELQSIRRMLHSGIAQARLSAESASKVEMPKVERKELLPNPERKSESEDFKPATRKADLPRLDQPVERPMPPKSNLPELAAAPAREIAATLSPSTSSPSAKASPSSRRDLEMPLTRRYIPPDAVIAEPSTKPLGQVVERLAPEPLAVGRDARGNFGSSPLGALEAVAPPRRETSTSARPPERKSPVVWTEKDFEKPGSMGLSRDLQLVINRAEGNRRSLLQRHGGSARTERAVQEALAWLAAHQDTSGKWGCVAFADRCPANDQCDGIAIERSSDTGVTGLALLAFLGAGHTPAANDPYGDVVKRGLDWLVKQLRERRHLMGNGNMYSHAMATLALTEAFMLTGDIRYRLPAQEAIDYIVGSQHPNSGGWRYEPGQFGDTSVFGWVVLALRSGEQAGLKVPESTWRQARRWLDIVCSGTHNGLAAYQPNYPPSHAMTAEALVCREILGTPRASKQLEEAGTYLLGKLPDNADYHVYYWYYGTVGMFQLGGSYWQRWNDRLTATLLDSQEKSGHRRGSWEPKKPFGVDGGRVFTTACSALCLEVYYRYLPLYDESGLSEKPSP